MGLFDRLIGDYVFLRGAMRALKETTPIAKNSTRVFPNIFEELAARYGDMPALLSERETLTYRELLDRSNRYARWALAQGVGKGETICLLMPNRPEYLALWLGFTRIGGVVALLNTNLPGPSLAHCIDIVAAKHIIVAAELFDAFLRARPLLKTAPRIWLHGDAAGDFPRIDREIAALSGDALAPAKRRSLTIEDRALYIYTSGTTGMPKAANVNHYRVMLSSYGFAGVIGTRPTDRMYDCLPMYHTVGGLCAIGSLLVVGGSV